MCGCWITNTMSVAVIVPDIIIQVRHVFESHFKPVVELIVVTFKSVSRLF